MKEGPGFEKKSTHCFTKDDIEINVKYNCYTAITSNRAYRKHTDPGTGRQVLNYLWRPKLQEQIEGGIAYVLKHYRWSTIQTDNSHQEHIERQIKNCLNENFQDEAISLSTKGLAVQTVGLIKIVEKPKLY
jgi:hypothetical protein